MNQLTWSLTAVQPLSKHLINLLIQANGLHRCCQFISFIRRFQLVFARISFVQLNFSIDDINLFIGCFNSMFGSFLTKYTLNRRKVIRVCKISTLLCLFLRQLLLFLLFNIFDIWFFLFAVSRFIEIKDKVHNLSICAVSHVQQAIAVIICLALLGINYILNLAFYRFGGWLMTLL